MPNYRKKPIVIEAVQWQATKASWDSIQSMGDIRWIPGPIGSELFFIETIEGDMRVSKGDWVIKGVAGEFYPCRDDIFRSTYEKVG